MTYVLRMYVGPGYQQTTVHCNTLGEAFYFMGHLTDYLGFGDTFTLVRRTV